MENTISDTILQGDALAVLRTLPAESVHCCVTSPPYYGLRDYGVPGQIGLEASVEEYVARLVEVFAEVRRVLRSDGTLWLNLGDSYANDEKWGGVTGGKHAKGLHGEAVGRNRRHTGLKPKDLIGIPWRVAFALQEAGWWLRSDIIWAKRNCMPESVTDRPTRSHEYIFLLAKAERYYYDAAAIREPAKESSIARLNQPTFDQQTGGPKDSKTGNRSHRKVLENLHARVAYRQRGHSRRHDGFNDRWDHMTKEEQQALGVNKRDVWHVATMPYTGAHFATFPPSLIEPCILAGCPAGGIALDPFFGSGTVGEVAIKHNRHYLGIELNAAYIALAEERLGRGIQRVLWSAS